MSFVTGRWTGPKGNSSLEIRFRQLGSHISAPFDEFVRKLFRELGSLSEKIGRFSQVVFQIIKFGTSIFEEFEQLPIPTEGKRTAIIIDSIPPCEHLFNDVHP